MVNIPDVSVVISTRNRPELLRKAVKSFIDQTYDGPIEVLIVFDQSEPDHTLESDDAHRRVKVLVNDSRSPGLAGARNTGILAARGEFVAFCDDDDFWMPQKLQRQLDTLGDALISVTGITVNYGDSRADRIPDPATFTLENLVRNRLMAAHPSSVLIRRAELLEKVGLVDEVLPGSYGEDFDLIIRALQAGPVSVVAEPLVEVLWGQSMFQRDWGTMVVAIDYLIAKHAVFRSDRRAMARLYGRRGFANAARGRRKDAFRDTLAAFLSWPLEKRVLVTLPVAVGAISAPRLLDIAHRRGRGI